MGFLHDFVLIIYRLGTYVPLAGEIPGFKRIMASIKGFIGMFNMFQVEQLQEWQYCVG